MSKYAASALSLLALHVSCGGASPQAVLSSAPPGAAAAPPSTPDAVVPAVQNTDDTKTTTVWGDTFTAPKGWWLHQSKKATVLQDPDKQISLTLRTEQAADAEHAAAQAWAAVDPSFTHPVTVTSRPSAEDGWDEIVQFAYELPGEAAPVLLARLYRHASTWHVILMRADKAAVGARGAQIYMVWKSLSAPGVAKESFAGRKALALSGDRLAAFDAFVESARIRSGIPGMAVAVVQNGKIVFEKGYGVRALGKPDAVTPHTRFMIGSTTKSLTSLMMARRIDAGAYTWDTPVTTLMPSFALGDAMATQKLLLKHTMCACTGMPRRDFEFFFQPPTVTPEARIAGMSTMKPTTGFGEVFQYSNTLVGAGGYIAARGYGGKKTLADSYDLAMRKEVFEPLGMRETSFDVAAVLRADHAVPSAHDAAGNYVPIRVADEAFVNSIRPAGAAWSTVHDMAAYLQMELARGVGPKGERYVSEANLLKRRERQVKVTEEMGYGLGLFVETPYGIARHGHAGNTLGFTSEAFFLPEHGVALTMLFNGGGAPHDVFERRFMEVLFDGAPKAQADMDAVVARRITKLDRARKQRTLGPGKAWFAPMLGKYTNPDLGDIWIRARGEGAELDVGDWQSPLAKKVGDDTVEQVAATKPPFDDFEFTPGADKVTGLRTLTFTGDEQHPYVFTEVKK